MTGLSIVIPVYNSAYILPQLIGKLESALQEPFEVIFINDGSVDDSWQVISSFAHSKPWLRGIDLAANSGQHIALLAGVRAARYSTIVTMDDDLQHPPNQIHKLVEKLDEGFDVVYGITTRRVHTFLRNILSRILYDLCSMLFGVPFIRDLSAFRAFKQSFCGDLRIYAEGQPFLHLLLVSVTSKITSVHVTYSERYAGRVSSSYSIFKLLKAAALFMYEARRWKNKHLLSIPLEKYNIPTRDKVNI